MLASRQLFGVLKWFQLFCFFHLVSAVCLTDQGSHFSFATSICGLVFLSLPQAFVVCSFFLCHRHLCTVSLFNGLFCRRHSCQTFCLCLVSACFRVSVYLSVFGIMLCSCCSQLHPWRFELEFSQSRLPCGQAYKFRFEANPIWYSAIKFTKSHSAKCSLHKWAWLRRSIKISSFEFYKFDPFSPHSRSIPRELVHSYALGCLWVVTVCCNTVGRHGQSFLSATGIHIQWTI